MLRSSDFLWALLRPHTVQRPAATSKFHIIVRGQRNCSDLPLGSLFFPIICQIGFGDDDTSPLARYSVSAQGLMREEL